VLQGHRLDSRKFDEFRAIEIALSRGESRSSAEVTLHGTRVLCVVTGIVDQPYAERGSEGILQINAEYSVYAEHIGLPANELRRLLDRAIRESDAIDLESLCIISRELVWKIQCDIQVLDCSGGNIIDCALYAAMAALRAYRKPDVSVHVLGSDDADEQTPAARSKIQVYSSLEREPFPLALHHTPLSCSIALFKLPTAKNASEGSSPDFASNKCFLQGSKASNALALVCDPSLAEERVMDGRIIISMTAHLELCAIHKPGGIPVSTEAILASTKLAVERIRILHGCL